MDGTGPASRGLPLAAQGDDLSWYVDGVPLAPDPQTGRMIWRPRSPGFFRLAVVDGQGRKAEAKVRVSALFQ